MMSIEMIMLMEEMDEVGTQAKVVVAVVAGASATPGRAAAAASADSLSGHQRHSED